MDAAGYSATLAKAQASGPSSQLIDQVLGAETPAELDVDELRALALDRIASKSDLVPTQRPPLASQLLNLPQLVFEAAFDPDSPVIRPQDYQAIGRIADALSDVRLLLYSFLVVGHTQASGRRTENLALSQRRADSIRTALVTNFKIASKRIRTLGLGEEQPKNSGFPASSSHSRIQVISLGRL